MKLSLIDITHKSKDLRNTYQSKHLYRTQADNGHPVQRTQMKFPRHFYLGSYFQMRVTPEPFVKGLSPSTHGR